MAAAYIFRLDDIAPNMLWSRYVQLRELFSRFGVKPLIAVVPQNEDPEFMRYQQIPVDFWSEIRERRKDGWHISLHGFRHCYDTQSPGLLGVSPRSEFAGHPFTEQLDRLKKAKAIFDRENVPVDTFVAPSHSFDDNTLQALKEVGVRTISDSFTFFPFFRDGILYVPQLTETPRWFPFGIITFCLHPNTMDDRLFSRVESFLEKHHKSVIRFDDARNYITENPFNLWAAPFTRYALKMKRCVVD